MECCVERLAVGEEGGRGKEEGGRGREGCLPWYVSSISTCTCVCTVLMC